MEDFHARIARTVSDSTRVVDATRAASTAHDVQFYRTEAYLTRAVVEYLADGVRAGQPIVVIATPPHRKAFAEGLRMKGLDTEQLFSGRLAVWLDARETLAAFMEGSHPNGELFFATIGRVFESILDKRDYLVVRGYGEMVDLLMKDANPQGALELERLWNELATRHAYSLLCGYSADNFLHETGMDLVRHVCGHHMHALPLEAFEENVA